MTIKIIVMVLCVLFSALFSGTEIVYSKVNKLHLSRDTEHGDKKSKRALDIANDFSKTITTILIGNNLVNIAMSSVSAIVAVELFQDIIKSESVLAILTTIAVTIIVLIFGEILPKTIFQNYCYSLSRKLTPFVTICTTILYPFVYIFNKIVNVLNKPFRKRLKEDGDDEEFVDDELITMTEELEESGVIDEDDAELIKSAIGFADTSAWEVMTPRVDVVAYDIDDGFENIIKDKKFYENSRVPIYKDTIDNIIGIVNTTKVLKKVLNREIVKLDDVIATPIYVHKTKPIASVLKELQIENKHLAIVLDEWGGVMGILTREDILEELFDEIWDETDIVEYEYVQIEDNMFIIDGDMNIYDFFDLIEYDDRDFESEYSTIGGWCTEKLDKFPDVGDHFIFENFEISIIEVDLRRVEKVKVVINEELNKEE